MRVKTKRYTNTFVREIILTSSVGVVKFLANIGLINSRQMNCKPKRCIMLWYGFSIKPMSKTNNMAKNNDPVKGTDTKVGNT